MELNQSSAYLMSLIYFCGLILKMQLDILHTLGHKIVVETETSLSKVSGY